MQPEDYVPDRIDVDWIESIALPAHPVLIEMEAEAERDGIPILDRASGRVLAALSVGRRRIVEVGTAIGYSTLWMALAQPDGGTIVTIDPDAGRTARARTFWERAGLGAERMTIVNERALDAFASGHRALAGPFDLAFVDALKPEYTAYLSALVPRLATGALVVADNVLYGGLVAGRRGFRPDERGAEAAAGALREFDAAVLVDPRFRATILPVGDGLLVAAFVGAGAA